MGPIFGPIMCIIVAVQHYFWWFLELVMSRDEIDLVEDEWNQASFQQVKPNRVRTDSQAITDASRP